MLKLLFISLFSFSVFNMAQAKSISDEAINSAIDSLQASCSDSHCAGDYHFSGEAFFCDQNKCEVFMDVFFYGDEDEIMTVNEFNQSPENLKKKDRSQLHSAQTYLEYTDLDENQRDLEIRGSCVVSIPSQVLEKREEQESFLVHSFLECTDNLTELIFKLNQTDNS